MVRTEPLNAIFLFLFVVLDVYVALGMPGIDVLNKRFNRFDLERQITLAQDFVKMTRGPKSWEKKWNEFVCYYETPALYVLQNSGVQFWTVPMRPFEPGVEPIFLHILECRLRNKYARDLKPRDSCTAGVIFAYAS